MEAVGEGRDDGLRAQVAGPPADASVIVVDDAFSAPFFAGQIDTSLLSASSQGQLPTSVVANDTDVDPTPVSPREKVLTARKYLLAPQSVSTFI